MDFKYEIINKIRVGEIKTAHGKINTPVFMPVGTVGSVKGVSSQELLKLGARIILGNTYHLYLRPGDDFIKKSGGLHQFINWKNPILTDSGGFQVFSLSENKFQNPNSKLQINNKFQNSNLETRNIKIVDRELNLVKIKESGVEFKSHIDGSKHFFTPESVIDTQIKFGSDIMMVLDVCTEFPATYKRAEETMELTHRWAKRSIDYFRGLQKRGIGETQNLFGIVQGSTYKDLRIKSAEYIASLNFDGIAIGGVSVGEGKQNMKKVIDWVVPYLPENKPRYLMGVGEPGDLIIAVKKGIDMFDCVLPTRLGRHGTVWVKKTKTQYQKIDLRKVSSKNNLNPIDKNCKCFACENNYSQAYISHLIKEKEIMGIRLTSLHNLWTIIHLVENLAK